MFRKFRQSFEKELPFFNQTTKLAAQNLAIFATSVFETFLRKFRK